VPCVLNYMFCGGLKKAVVFYLGEGRVQHRMRDAWYLSVRGYGVLFVVDQLRLGVFGTCYLRGGVAKVFLFLILWSVVMLFGGGGQRGEREAVLVDEEEEEEVTGEGAGKEKRWVWD